MIHIKKFIDRVAAAEGRQNKDIVLPLADARGLRDEITKIIVDLYSTKEEKPVDTVGVVEIELKGGTFK